MSRTMSVRMDRDNYDFLHEITKEEGSHLSKAVRDMVTRGRILLAVERYKTGEASLGRAAELAGFLGKDDDNSSGIRSRKQVRKKEDYRQGHNFDGRLTFDRSFRCRGECSEYGCLRD